MKHMAMPTVVFLDIVHVEAGPPAAFAGDGLAIGRDGECLNRRHAFKALRTVHVVPLRAPTVVLLPLGRRPWLLAGGHAMAHEVDDKQLPFSPWLALT
jgi:hypothetical protein